MNEKEKQTSDLADKIVEITQPEQKNRKNFKKKKTFKKNELFATLGGNH